MLVDWLLVICTAGVAIAFTLRILRSRFSTRTNLWIARSVLTVFLVAIGLNHVLFASIMLLAYGASTAIESAGIRSPNKHVYSTLLYAGVCLNLFAPMTRMQLSNGALFVLALVVLAVMQSSEHDLTTATSRPEGGK